MPLLSSVERRSPRGKVLILGIYLLLTLGGITMVHPFLLMLGTSLTNNADNEEFTVWPAYLLSDEALYRKYLCERYDQDVEVYNALHGTRHTGFAEIEGHAVRPGDAAQAADLERFIEDEIRGKHITLARVFYQKYPFRVIESYNDWLLERFGELEVINQRYCETQIYTGQYLFPYDAPLYRLPKIKDNPKEKDYTEFKATVTWTWLCLPSSHSRFRRFVKERYPKLADINAAWGTRYERIEDIRLPWTRPKEAGTAADWDAFVKRIWPRRLVRSDGSLLTSERLWAEYLEGRYRGLAELNEAYGADLASFSEVPIPYAAVDRVDFDRTRSTWRWDFMTGNYSTVLDYLFVRGRAGINTVILVLGTILLQLTINPLCAYALSRFRMKSTYAILLFCLATMSFPAEVAMIPNFILLKKLGFLNTFWALLLPGAANGFFIFLLKGFFDSLPDELFEAAAIDGAGPLRSFWSIALPLCKPVLAVIALQAFVHSYGSFMWAYIVCQDSSLWTLMVYIHQFQLGNPVHLIMAALVLASIPTLIVFLMCQKVILRGIVVPTMK